VAVKRGIQIGILLAVVLLAAVSSYVFLSSTKGNASSTQATSTQLTSSTQSPSGVANVTVVESSFRADGGGSGTTLSAACAPTPAQSYVKLTNIGNAPTSVIAVKLYFGGDTYNAPLSGCGIGAHGSSDPIIYLNFDTGGSNLAFGSSGDPVVIYITLANGEQISGESQFS
jgi:hypothetical protein